MNPSSLDILKAHMEAILQKNEANVRSTIDGMHNKFDKDLKLLNTVMRFKPMMTRCKLFKSNSP